MYIKIVSLRFMIVITLTKVTIETNVLAVISFMNVSYVVGHGRVSSLLFQCILSIL